MMKEKLITGSNHELALREIAYLQRGKAQTELYNLNSTTRLYDQKVLDNIVDNLSNEPSRFYIFNLRELEKLKSFQVSDELRKMGLRTIAGGSYASSNTEDSLKHFDAVVVGDAKNGLGEALSGKKGIIFGGIAKPEIESYDVPLFYLKNNRITKSPSGVRPFKHPQYKETTELSFTTMRGCAQSCSYCEVSQLRKKFPDYGLRKKSLEDTLVYIKEKADDINPNYINIWDEDFLLHNDNEINRFVKLYKDIGIPFFIFATPKTVLKGEEKLGKLAKVGLNQVNIGIQSGSERIQKQLFGRKESLEEGKEATKILANLYKKNNTTMKPPMIDFITLNPYENKNDVMASISYALDLPRPFNLIAHIMSFFEGTPLKSDALQKGIINDDYSFDYDMHDFVNHAKDALTGRRKNSPENIYLSSVLFRMRGIHDGEKCGMIDRREVENLLSKSEILGQTRDINGVIEEINRKYNPMNL